MSDVMTLELAQQQDFRFEVRLGGAVPALTTDEPPPLGGDAGPNPARLLGAAVANCLAASLLFALRKFRNTAAEPLRASTTVTEVRNAQNRLRIGRVAVGLHLAAPAAELRSLDRVLAQFEDFCIVTQSVRPRGGRAGDRRRRARTGSPEVARRGYARRLSVRCRARGPLPTMNPSSSHRPGAAMKHPSISTLAGLLAASCAVSAQTSDKVDLAERKAPDVSTLPTGPYRDLVAFGEQLAMRTYAHIGPEVKDPARRYAGNNLACTSCHEGAATKAFAMPWVGVAATFPQYRAREDDVSTVEERVNGCMQRSMNGRALPLESREMKAFVAYISFLSRGIPVGATLEGAGTKQSRLPNRRADPEAGRAVYQARCAVCHGADGQGVRVGRAGDAQGYTFPPLWGPDSFNTGAGMNRLAMATRFVASNMPLGATHAAPQLTIDEAYDASAYVLSQPRPEKSNLEADFPARWNKPVDAAFPPYLLGTPDQHKYGPFPPLAEKQKQLADKLKAEAAARTAAR